MKPSVFLSSHVGERERGRGREIEDEEVEEEEEESLGVPRPPGYREQLEQVKEIHPCLELFQPREKVHFFSLFAHTLYLASVVCDKIGRVRFGR